MGEEITADLTLIELRRKLIDNVGYKADGSLEKARLFIDAGRAILALGIEESEHDGERVRVNLTLLERQLAEAERWRASQAATNKLAAYQPAAGWRDD